MVAPGGLLLGPEDQRDGSVDRLRSIDSAAGMSLTFASFGGQQEVVDGDFEQFYWRGSIRWWRSCSGGLISDLKTRT